MYLCRAGWRHSRCRSEDTSDARIHQVCICHCICTASTLPNAWRCSVNSPSRAPLPPANRNPHLSIESIKHNLIRINVESDAERRELTRAGRYETGPLSTSITGSRVIANQKESALALVNDVGSDAERSGADVTIGPTQQSYGPEAIHTGNAQNGSSRTFGKRAADFAARCCNSVPFAVFGAFAQR